MNIGNLAVGRIVLDEQMLFVIVDWTAGVGSIQSFDEIRITRLPTTDV